MVEHEAKTSLNRSSKKGSLSREYRPDSSWILPGAGPMASYADTSIPFNATRNSSGRFKFDKAARFELRK